MTKSTTSTFASRIEQAEKSRIAPPSAAPAAPPDAAAGPVPSAPNADPARDAAAITGNDWPTRILAGSAADRAAGFAAVFAQSALDEIHLHGQSAPSIEVCGVLVGRCCRDGGGPYLLVEHVIRGNGASSRSTNVTFTAQTWQHIQGVMDDKFPDKKIVGWYHTHPGFGIFLSEMDLFICENFFNLPWQCAFVYDPKSGEEGNFLWRQGKPTREPILIEDDVTPKAAAVPLISVADAMGRRDASANAASSTPTDAPAPATAAQIEQLLARVHGLERRQRLLFTSVAFLAAFVLMWAAEVSNLGPSWLRPWIGPMAPPPAPTSPAAPAHGPAAKGPAAHAPAHPETSPHPQSAPRPQSPSTSPPIPQVLRQ